MELELGRRYFAVLCNYHLAGNLIWFSKRENGSIDQIAFENVQVVFESGKPDEPSWKSYINLPNTVLFSFDNAFITEWKLIV